jgi:hypothetical protein
MSYRVGVTTDICQGALVVVAGKFRMPDFVEILFCEERGIVSQAVRTFVL